MLADAITDTKWATVASAAGAAVGAIAAAFAACASWRAVSQATAQSLPHLNMQPTYGPGHNFIGVTLRNDRGSVARRTHLMVAITGLGLRFAGWPLDGFVSPGDGFRARPQPVTPWISTALVNLNLNAVGFLVVVVSCRRLVRRSHLWSAGCL